MDAEAFLLWYPFVGYEIHTSQHLLSSKEGCSVSRHQRPDERYKAGDDASHGGDVPLTPL